MSPYELLFGLTVLCLQVANDVTGPYFLSSGSHTSEQRQELQTRQLSTPRGCFARWLLR